MLFGVKALLLKERMDGGEGGENGGEAAGEQKEGEAGGAEGGGETEEEGQGEGGDGDVSPVARGENVVAKWEKEEKEAESRRRKAAAQHGDLLKMHLQELISWWEKKADGRLGPRERDPFQGKPEEEKAAKEELFETVLAVVRLLPAFPTECQGSLGKMCDVGGEVCERTDVDLYWVERLVAYNPPEVLKMMRSEKGIKQLVSDMGMGSVGKVWAVWGKGQGEREGCEKMDVDLHWVEQGRERTDVDLYWVERMVVCNPPEVLKMMRSEKGIKQLEVTMQERKVRSSEEVVAQMVSNSAAQLREGGVETEAFVLSLKCPLSLTRIKVPVRGKKCSHESTFDLASYLRMNQGLAKNVKRAWRCPVCYQQLLWSELFLDGFMQKILDEANEEVDEVEVFPDGRWRRVESGDGEDGSCSESDEEERMIMIALKRREEERRKKEEEEKNKKEEEESGALERGAEGDGVGLSAVEDGEERGSRGGEGEERRDDGEDVIETAGEEGREGMREGVRGGECRGECEESNQAEEVEAVEVTGGNQQVNGVTIESSQRAPQNQVEGGAAGEIPGGNHQVNGVTLEFSKRAPQNQVREEEAVEATGVGGATLELTRMDGREEVERGAEAGRGGAPAAAVVVGGEAAVVVVGGTSSAVGLEAPQASGHVDRAEAVGNGAEAEREAAAVVVRGAMSGVAEPARNAGGVVCGVHGPADGLTGVGCGAHEPTEGMDGGIEEKPALQPNGCWLERESAREEKEQGGQCRELVVGGVVGGGEVKKEELVWEGLVIRGVGEQKE
ncbi:unnamed protein product [Closterium sp. Yama58-4]|nr:unnamed protein product [Closterium sp. Yama58-4]